MHIAFFLQLNYMPKVVVSTLDAEFLNVFIYNRHSHKRKVGSSDVNKLRSIDDSKGCKYIHKRF